MSGVFKQDYYKTTINCSGVYMPSMRSIYEEDQIYEGMGINYKKMKCKFCDSTINVVEGVQNNCVNCGASY